MNRRDFIKYCGTLGLTLSLPERLFAQNEIGSKKTIILIELQGGNDGLNTVIPYTDPLYYALRPTIGLKNSEIIKLNNHLALHASLEPLMPLWEQHQLNIMLGLGYEKPNLSHFRSIEIWNTNATSDQYLEHGWLSAYLEGFQKASPLSIANGLVLGGEQGPLLGVPKTLQIKNIARFLSHSKSLSELPESTTTNSALLQLIKTHNTIQNAALTIKTHLKPLQAPKPFENHPFSKQFALATQIIQSDLNIPVIKLNLSSFDTHVNQRPQHARLLKILAQTINSAQRALKATGHWQNTVIMTYSEFGRRAKENGSKGTDHGTAAPHFIMGGHILDGFSGSQPPLSDLTHNNLKFTTHFSALYQKVIAT